MAGPDPRGPGMARHVPWRSLDEADRTPPPTSARRGRGCLSSILIPLLVLAVLVAVSIAIAAAGGGS